MRKKITVFGIVCLYIWNVALAGVPSMLLCLHEGELLHVEPVEAESLEPHHCEKSHEPTVFEAENVCSIEQECTDVELAGGELLPLRLNEVESITVPTFEPMVAPYDALLFSALLKQTIRLPMLRAPPDYNWLTDTCISKTVILV